MKNKYKLNPLTSLIETVNCNCLFDVMELSEIRQVARALRQVDDLFKRSVKRLRLCLSTGHYARGNE